MKENHKRKNFLGKDIEVKIYRQVGTMSPDGEKLDAYLLGRMNKLQKNLEEL